MDLPDNEYPVFVQGQVTVFVIEEINMTFLGLVLMGIILKIKTFYDQLFPLYLFRFFRAGKMDFQDAAVFP